MLMFAWFWAATAAFTPMNLLTMSAQAFEAQTATIEAIARPLMTLGWVDEDDAPIF
jgi:hypothetical protein